MPKPGPIRIHGPAIIRISFIFFHHYLSSLYPLLPPPALPHLNHHTFLRWWILSLFIFVQSQHPPRTVRHRLMVYFSITADSQYYFTLVKSFELLIEVHVKLCNALALPKPIRQVIGGKTIRQDSGTHNSSCVQSSPLLCKVILCKQDTPPLNL